MTTTTDQVKTCQCGCGAPVARSFKPGHDAQLKGRLIRAAKAASSWQARNAAIFEMVERSWGHFLPTEMLSAVKISGRSVRTGRRVQSLHIAGLASTVVDERGTAHSHRFCDDVVGETHRVEGVGGWACVACIHTEDLAEAVGKVRRAAVALAATEVGATL